MCLIKDHQTIEAFNFSIQNNGSRCQRDSLYDNNYNNSTLMTNATLYSDGDKSMVELESQFRSFLLKISECGSTLQPLPSGTLCYIAS